MTNTTALPKNHWNLKLAGYFSIINLVVFGIIASVPLLFFGFPIPIIPAVIATVAAQIVAIIVALFVSWEPKNWKTLLGLNRPSVKSIFIGLGVGVLSFLLLQIVGTILVNVGLEIESSETSLALTEGTGVSKLVLLLLLVPFVVPACEELFFRGYTLTFILRGHGAENKPIFSFHVMLAIIVSSFYFALVHIQGFGTFGDFFIPVWIFIIAIANGILRVKYNSVYVSIASHSVYNLMTSLLILAQY